MREETHSCFQKKPIDCSKKSEILPDTTSKVNKKKGSDWGGRAEIGLKILDKSAVYASRKKLPLRRCKPCN